MNPGQVLARFIMSESRSIARSIAALVLVALTGIFLYQTAEGLGFVRSAEENAYFPPLAPVPGYLQNTQQAAVDREDR